MGRGRRGGGRRVWRAGEVVRIWWEGDGWWWLRKKGLLVSFYLFVLVLIIFGLFERCIGLFLECVTVDLYLKN